jgi:hypothetical protein
LQAGLFAGSVLPKTKYARSGDVRIAYQITGEDPFDVVWAPGTMSHLDLDWEMPQRALFFERFSKFCRLIRIDRQNNRSVTLDRYALSCRLGQTVGCRVDFYFGNEQSFGAKQSAGRKQTAREKLGADPTNARSGNGRTVATFCRSKEHRAAEECQ